jgi:hypothetical protein
LSATATGVRLITRRGYNWADRYPWIVEGVPKNRQLSKKWRDGLSK